jgi:hypothetical protein
VSLAVPWALLGLLLIPLLIWLERWRRRPRWVVWPSLLLWRAIGDTARERARRIEPLLLLECAAVLLLTLAAAGPTVRTGVGARKVVVVLETGPRTGALIDDGRTVLEATRAQLDRIRDALAVGDEWIVQEVERAEAAPAVGDIRILATNRPGMEGPGFLVVGRAPRGPNIGFSAVRVEGGQVGFAVRREDGAAPVTVRAGDRALSVTPDTWTTIRTTGTLGDSLRIATANCYPGDDEVRLRAVRMKVRTDAESALVLAALRVGVPAERGEPADFVLETGGGSPLPGRIRGAECRVSVGLFDGLALDECRWEGARGIREPGLLAWGEWTLARWTDERTLWLGVPVDRPWDDFGTLALLLERAKRERARALLADGEALVGDAIAAPAPGFVETRGVDRPWDGVLPAARVQGEGVFDLRAVLAVAAAIVLLIYAARLRDAAS